MRQKYLKLLALPPFLFLCLDFLYRLSESTNIRDAFLSFSILELLFISVAGLLSLGLAGLQLVIKRDFLELLTAYLSALLTLWLGLIYLRNWVFSFTVLGEQSKFFMGRNAMGLVLVVLSTAFLAFLWKKGRLSSFLAVVSLVANRFWRLTLGTAVLSVLMLVIGLLGTRSPSNTAQQAIKGENKKNVVLLVFDALGAKHLSSYGYRNNQTPTFDRLAGESYFFTNARTNFTATAVSILTMLTGQSPLKTHFIDYNRVPSRLSHNDLLTFLEKQGYRTESLVGAEYASLRFLGLPQPSEGEGDHRVDNLSNQLNRIMASACKKLGFSLQFLVHPFMGGNTTLESFFDQLLGRLKILSQHPEPFFLYAHTNTEVYMPPVNFDNPRIRDLGGWGYYDPQDQPVIDQFRESYDQAVSKADAQLTRFLEELKKEGLLENTIIIVTADHGESFERGFWGHGNDLSEASIRVPLIIHAPGQHPMAIDNPVQTSDIAPTVLELLGMTPPEWMDGISGLNSPHRREAAVTFNFLTGVQIRQNVPFPGLSSGRSVAIYKNGLKYVENPEGKKDELYDLISDPEEAQNSIDLRPAEARKLHEELGTLLKGDAKAFSDVTSLERGIP